MITERIVPVSIIQPAFSYGCVTLKKKKLSMRKITVVIALLVVTSLAWAQRPETGIVKLRGTRLTYPLVSKWISEFKNEYPNIIVTIAQEAPADSIDLNLAAHSIVEGDLKENQDYVAVTRYVQLPVANSHHPALQTLQAKGFRESDFNNLYFTNSTPSFLTVSNSPITLYTRERPTCATITFARHFGNDPKEIKGIGVKGDDQDLAKAVKEDINGISFNNLGFIYDLKTRKVVEDLAIIPVDINENGKVDSDEEIYGKLDEVIAYVERTGSKKFVTEYVNVLFNKSTPNAAAGLFLSWTLTKGQKFNHAYGFLSLEEKPLDEQKAIVNKSFKISAVSSCEGLNDALKERKGKLVAHTAGETEKRNK
jgi:phosphate transport system substrate-binding protein